VSQLRKFPELSIKRHTLAGGDIAQKSGVPQATIDLFLRGGDLKLSVIEKLCEHSSLGSKEELVDGLGANA
jgi:hypothetical protein